MNVAAIKTIIRSKTFSQSILSTSSTIINGTLGIIFYILIARFLDPSSFGIFFICVTSISLISDISKIGIDTSIVNFVGKNIAGDKEKALRFLKYGFKKLLIVSISVAFLGWILIPKLSQLFFEKNELISPLAVSLLGVITASLFLFSTSSLQAIQKFLEWSFVNISMNFLRLILILTLFLTGNLSIMSALIVYISTPFVGFLISFIFLPNFLFVKNEGLVSKEFLKFNKWVIVFTVISAVASRLDTFLSGKFLSLSDLGIYSVAVNLSAIVPQIVVAIATVAAPKVASFNNRSKVIAYLRKLQIFVIALSCLGLVFGIIFGYLLINYYYGFSYSNSFFPFVILLIAQVVFLISVPVHSAVIYYFSYPKLFFLTAFVNLIIILVGGNILIPVLGYIGASILVLIGNISNLLIPSIWVYKKFKQSK